MGMSFKVSTQGFSVNDEAMNLKPSGMFVYAIVTPQSDISLELK